MAWPKYGGHEFIQNCNKNSQIHALLLDQIFGSIKTGDFSKKSSDLIRKTSGNTTRRVPAGISSGFGSGRVVPNHGLGRVG